MIHKHIKLGKITDFACGVCLVWRELCLEYIVVVFCGEKAVRRRVGYGEPVPKESLRNINFTYNSYPIVQMQSFHGSFCL